MFNVFLLFCVPLTIIGYILFILQWKKNPQKFYPKDRPLVFGHRGSPTYITENTLSSFEKAIVQGVDGLELDVRLTKDKQIVIFHDSGLQRLVGINKKIKNLTYSELQEIKLEQDQTIPLLDDFVPLLEKIKAVNIEIKSDGILRGHGIINPLIKFLDKYNINDKCILSSLNPLILLRFKLKRPKTIIGYLYNRNLIFHPWNNLVWITRIRPENLHIHYSLLDSWIVKWARKKGMYINSYTINDKKAFDNSEIDGVFTDNIEYIK